MTPEFVSISLFKNYRDSERYDVRWLTVNGLVPDFVRRISRDRDNWKRAESVKKST